MVPAHRSYTPPASASSTHSPAAHARAHRPSGPSSASTPPADDDAGRAGGGSKRQRVHYSCTECHRRKQKCNRETPCQHCIARKVPDRCKVFQPGDDPNDVQMRIDKLERSVEGGFANLYSLLSGLARNMGSAGVGVTEAAGPTSGRESADDASQPKGGAKKRKRNEAAAAVASGAADKSSHSDDDEANETGRLSPETGHFAGTGAMTMKIANLLDTLSGQDQKTGASSAYIPDDEANPVRSFDVNSGLDQILYEYGAPDSISKVLVAALPPRELADALIDHFYNDVNWLRQPVPQRYYRKKIAEFWASGPTVTLENINIYAFFTTALALAMLSFARFDLVPDDPRLLRLIARRLQYVGRRALYTSTMLGREDMDQVIAWLTCSRFLLLDRRIPEGWTCAAQAVKSAHSIGLHRDGEMLRLPPQLTRTRRQIWSAVVFADRTLSMNLGRPSTIDDRFCDSKPPGDEVEDDYFMSVELPPASSLPIPRGLTCPTPLSYAKLRHGLAKIMGKIITAYQTVEAPVHYSEILSIDEELQAIRDTWPPWYRAELIRSGPDAGTLRSDRSLDDKLPFIPAHRFLLLSEYDFVRIALHRPYLLRSSGKNGSRFLPSRRACIESAHHDILLRHDFVRGLRATNPPEYVRTTFNVHIGTFRWFNSLLICGMASLLDPHADEAPVWRAHLEEFVEIMEKKKQKSRDDMREKEASIAALFLARIDELREQKGKQSGGAGRASRKSSLDDSRRRKTDGLGSSNAGNHAGSNSSSRRASPIGHDDEGDAHATAGLLLGLGKQQPTRFPVPGRSHPGQTSPSTSSTPTERDGAHHDMYTAGSSNNGTRFPGGTSTPGRHGAAGSPKDWRRGVQGSSSTANLQSQGNAALPSPASVNGNSSGDDAQAMLEAWYRADMASGGSVFESAFSHQPPMFGQGQDLLGTVEGLLPGHAGGHGGGGPTGSSAASAYETLGFGDGSNSTQAHLLPPTSTATSSSGGGGGGGGPSTSSAAQSSFVEALAASPRPISSSGLGAPGSTPFGGLSSWSQQFVAAQPYVGPPLTGSASSPFGQGASAANGNATGGLMGAGTNGGAGAAGGSQSFGAWAAGHASSGGAGGAGASPGGDQGAGAAGAGTGQTAGAAAAAAGAAQAGGQGATSAAALIDSFDPSFWQNLINKISA